MNTAIKALLHPTLFRKSFPFVFNTKSSPICHALLYIRVISNGLHIPKRERIFSKLLSIMLPLSLILLRRHCVENNYFYIKFTGTIQTLSANGNRSFARQTTAPAPMFFAGILHRHSNALIIDFLGSLDVFISIG